MTKFGWNGDCIGGSFINWKAFNSNMQWLTWPLLKSWALSVTLICWELSLMLSSRLRASSISCAFRFFSTCSLCFSVATFLLWSFICLQEAQAKIYKLCQRTLAEHERRERAPHIHTNHYLYKKQFDLQAAENKQQHLRSYMWNFFITFPFQVLKDDLKKKKKGRGGDSKHPKANENIFADGGTVSFTANRKQTLYLLSSIEKHIVGLLRVSQCLYDCVVWILFLQHHSRMSC